PRSGGEGPGVRGLSEGGGRRYEDGGEEPACFLPSSALRPVSVPPHPGPLPGVPREREQIRVLRSCAELCRVARCLQSLLCWCAEYESLHGRSPGAAVCRPTSRSALPVLARRGERRWLAYPRIGRGSAKSASRSGGPYSKEHWRCHRTPSG